jgi:hypothetical protein
LIFFLNTTLYKELNTIGMTSFGYILLEIWNLQYSMKICEIIKENLNCKTLMIYWAGPLSASAAQHVQPEPAPAHASTADRAPPVREREGAGEGTAVTGTRRR